MNRPEKELSGRTILSTTQSDVVAPTEARHFSLNLDDIQAGEIAPPFTGPLLDGGTFDLTELRGTPVLFMLWADWCPPCPDSLAPFQNVADQWGDRVTFVSVLTSKSTPEIAAGIIEEQSFTLPVVIDYSR